MSHFDPENPWGFSLDPVDHDTFIDDVPARPATRDAEVPKLKALAELDHPIGSVRLEEDLLVPSAIAKARAARTKSRTTFRPSAAH
jgi:hypothetical protein